MANDADTQALIDALNEDLAGELSAMIQYLTYSAKVTGPHRLQLKEFFLSEVSDEQGHAEFLAHKVVALGGEPTTTPRPVVAAETNREMVEAVLAAEERAVRDYTARVRQVEAYGDLGLQVKLEDIIADETRHKEETALLLQDWTGD